MFQCVPPSGAAVAREALEFAMAAWVILFVLVFGARWRDDRRLLGQVLVGVGFWVGMSALAAALAVVPSGEQCAAPSVVAFLSSFASWLVVGVILIPIGLGREGWRRWRAARRRARAGQHGGNSE